MMARICESAALDQRLVRCTDKKFVRNFPLMFMHHAEQLLELHRGQGMDIYWRDSHVCPSEEDYKEMVIRSECPYTTIAIFLLLYAHYRVLFLSVCRPIFLFNLWSDIRIFVITLNDVSVLFSFVMSQVL